MPHRSLPIAELGSLPWSDASMTALTWTNGNRDVRLTVELPGGRSVVLDFQWADRLRMNLAFEERHNYPPTTWEVTVAPSRDGRHTITLDFTSNGSLALDFEAVTVDGIWYQA